MKADRSEQMRGVAAMERLRSRFEALGYAVQVEPAAATLPPFMAGYRPDAVAERGDDRIAIELRSRRSEGGDLIADLRRRFEDQPGWRLAVVYPEEDVLDAIEIPTGKIDNLRTAAGMIYGLVEKGSPAAALVMSFSLLEAALNATSPTDFRAKRPGTVVQALASEGAIDRETEGRLRKLVEVRNRIVHGDLTLAVDPADVRLVLGAVETTLALAFAA